MRLTAGPGPGSAPADRAGTGFRAGVSTSYRFDPERASAAVLVRVDHVIAEPDELRVALFPECGDVVDGVPDFAAAYVGVRVRFAEGDAIGDELIDQDGIGGSPAQLGDSGTTPPMQWTLKRYGLGRWTGRRVVAVELVAAPTARGPHAAVAHGWVEFDGFRAPVPRGSEPADWVDTRRGSRSTAALSRGNTAPLLSRPHGGVFAVPVTDASRDDWIYAWSAHDDAGPHLEAVALSSIPSPWVGDRGVLQVFPLRGGVDPDRRSRRRAFSHDDERAGADEYEVRFRDGGRIVLHAGEHSVEVVMDDPHGIAAVVLDQLDDRGAVLGHEHGGVGIRVDGTSRASAGAPARFVWLTTDQPSGELAVGVDSARPRTSALLRLARPVTRVRVRMGSSAIGVREAREHVEREMPWIRSSEELRAEARRAWEPLLGALVPHGASAEERLTLTSSLHRMHLYPNDAAEPTSSGEVVHVDAMSPPAAPDRPARTGRTIRRGRAFVNNGFWDTYRTVWPWYCLRDPEHAAELFDGMVALGIDGGWMPRWSAPGALDAMVGTNSDVVAAAVLQALPGWGGAERAYDLAVRNATAPGPVPGMGRRDIRRSRFRGWVASSVPESVSWTLEGAICDAAIAGMATRLAARHPHGPRAREYAADAVYFDLRSRDHVALFDPSSGFYRGRDEQGRFGPDFDPRRWGGDYTETNGWGTAFSAPHDPAGLAALHGGPEGLGRRLDEFFTVPETAEPRWRGTYPDVIHEMVEARNMRMGMFGLSNQPAHHIPAIYAASDRPWRTAEVTLQALATRFTGSEIGAGYPGDEDNGELSAWFVLNALGLYPLMPGGDWVLTAPLLPEMRLRRPSGDLVVTASRSSRSDRFIQRVSVDGEDWDSPFLPHDVIADGARIDVRLGSEPSRWGIGGVPEVPTPRARRDLSATARIDGPAGSDRLTDDLGGSAVPLQVGHPLTIRLAEPARVAVFTLTAASPGTLRWRAVLRTASGVEAVEEYCAAWDLADRTRAFLPPTDAPIRSFSIEALPGPPLLLTQVEVLERVADVAG